MRLQKETDHMRSSAGSRRCLCPWSWTQLTNLPCGRITYLSADKRRGQKWASSWRDEDQSSQMWGSDSRPSEEAGESCADWAPAALRCGAEERLKYWEEWAGGAWEEGFRLCYCHDSLDLQGERLEWNVRHARCQRLVEKRVGNLVAVKADSGASLKGFARCWGQSSRSVFELDAMRQMLEDRQVQRRTDQIHPLLCALILLFQLYERF